MGYDNHIDPFFKNCKIFKLSDTYQHKVCSFLDNFITKKLPHSFDDMSLIKSVNIEDDHMKRQFNHTNAPSCNSTLSTKVALFNFPIIWNN